MMHGTHNVKLRHLSDKTVIQYKNVFQPFKRRIKSHLPFASIG